MHAQAAPAMTFDQLLDKVRYNAAYPTRQRAEEAVHAVLAALGRQLAGPERDELAARLPQQAARTLTTQQPTGEPLTGWGFVKDIAAHTGGSHATTRWDTGSVLIAVADLAGPGLLTRVLAALPPGYALLFGRAELVQAA
jgi:uncharacterized protein (DUF2267 family)